MYKIVFFLLLFSPPLFGQNEFYVSPAGNNAAAGTLLQPWRTAQFAIDHASPGCTIYLMGGSYHENLEMTVSGTAGSPVTLTSYAGQAAVIDGTGTSGTHLLRISGKSYIHVEQLEFTQLSRNNACGILIEGNSNFVELKNNFIHHIHFSANAADPVIQGKTAHAIAVNGTDGQQQLTSLVIASNTVTSCRTGKGAAIEIAGNVTLFTITRNKIADITNSGIGLTSYTGVSSEVVNDRPENGMIAMNTVHDCISEAETAAGILVDGAMLCRVENNALYGNTTGILICCSATGKAAAFISCRNNSVYRNYTAGLFIGGFVFPTDCGAVENCSILCNTFFDNNFSNTGAEILLGYTSGTTMKNNIVDGFSNTVLVKSTVPQSLLTLDFNLYFCQSIPEFRWNGNPTFSFAGWQTITQFDQHSFFSNPQLINSSDANLHLEMSSPAIDRGDSSYLANANEVDMDTMTRIQNGRVDIGADEYGTAVGIVENKSATATMFYDQAGTEMIIRFAQPQIINTSVFLYDTNGKNIGVAEAKKGDSSVKFSNNLASGVYFVSANGVVLKIVR